MRTGLLHLHNFNRWIILIIALLAVVRYLMGFLRKDDFTKTDDKLSLFLVIFSDIQLLGGLYLWFTGSAFMSMMASMKDTMQDPINRFFAVEHTLGMILALVLIHIGRAKIKKTADNTAKFKKGLIYFAIALIIVLLSIPWPFSPAARPWFPGMSL